MRITPSMTMATTLRDLNGAYSRLSFSQAQMASGRKLVSASDDPSTASNAMALRNQLARYDSFDSSITDAQGWLNTADSALTTASDSLVTIKGLVVQASNSGGISDPAARQALMSQVKSIRDDLLSIANTSYGNRSVFAGTAAGKAYDANGTYLGNTGSVMRDVDPHTSVAVNVTGLDAFGDPASAKGDLFAVLDRVATAIGNGDQAALTAAHTDLDAAFQRLNGAAAEIGARGAQMQARQTRSADERQRLSSLLSDTEDVDIAKVMVELKARDNAYQASLQVAAQVLPKSLVDYLR